MDEALRSEMGRGLKTLQFLKRLLLDAGEISAGEGEQRDGQADIPGVRALLTY